MTWCVSLDVKVWKKYCLLTSLPRAGLQERILVFLLFRYLTAESQGRAMTF